jgi:hypothetical protein
MTNIRVRLADIAHARSGDKADWVDFGLSEAEFAASRSPRVGWWPELAPAPLPLPSGSP